MAFYTYKGRVEKTGEPVSGTRESSGHAQLGQDLLAEGVLLTRFELKQRKSGAASIYSSIFEKVPLLERVMFARYFALMLRAGLDVKQAISSLKEQARSKPLKKALQGVIEAVERGTTLAESMATFPNAFSQMFISFIKVGEATGRLQESLEVLGVQLQKEYELKRAVMGALLYPIIIVVALIAVGFAMLVFVIPKLAEVFEGFDVKLPITTRILIGAGVFFEQYWWLVLILMAFGLVGAYFLLRVKKIKDKIMHVILLAPVIGPIVRHVNLARFTRNMSSLLTSGVSFVEALDILGENTPHASYAKVFKGAKEHVKKGKLLSLHLAEYKKLFPPLVINVVKVGEETGALDEVLQEVALFYEAEVDQTMKNLTSIIEPILMVVIGLAVGALAISVISPIYSLVNVI